MKKILSILLVLAMLFSVAALAEGGSGSTPPGDPPDGTMGTPPDGGMGTPPDGMPGNGGGFGGGTPPGGGTSSFEYTAATEITAAAEQSGETYTSESADESALMIRTADTVTIDNPTVTKTGDSSGGDSCNFYGLNAALLVMGGADATITGGTITSDASGANGVFCYGGNGASNGASGDGTTKTISDTVITSTGEGSGVIITTG